MTQPNSLVRRLASGAVPLLLIGCGSLPLTPGPALAQSSDSATGNSLGHSLDMQRMATPGQLMYEVMVAELAGRRGYLDVATEGYLRAARHSDDARVAERATKLGVFGRYWDLALAANRRWLELDGVAVEAHELLGQIHLRRAAPAEAASAFVSLIEHYDNRPDALRLVYSILAGEPDEMQALTVMQSLQAHFETEAEAHLGVARLRLMSNGRDAALLAADQALALEPANADALLIRAQVLLDLGKPAESFDMLSDALEADPENMDLRTGYARLLVSAGRYAEASEELETLFEAAPDEPDLLLSIGELALDSKRLEAARKYFTQLRTTGAHADQAAFSLARIADQQHEYEAAIGHYDDVSDQQFNMAFASRLRAAELHARIDKVDEALERLHTLGTSVSDPSVKPQLLTSEGRILQQADRSAEAVEVLTRGLSDFPQNGELLYARALVAETVGNNAMVEKDLGTLIGNEPDNAHALNALGYFLTDQKGRIEEAAGYLERAIALKPDDAAIMDSLGWLRYRQGRYAESVKLLRAAYEHFPDGEIAAHLGEVLWVSGQKEQAQAIWDDALASTPDNPHVLKAVKKFAE